MSEELKLIKPLRQEKIGKHGDCVRSALAMVLGEDSIHAVPNLNDPEIRVKELGFDCIHQQHETFSLWLLENRDAMVANLSFPLSEKCRIEDDERQFYNPTDSLAYLTDYGTPLILSVISELNRGHMVVIDPFAYGGDMVLYEPNPDRPHLQGMDKISEAFETKKYKIVFPSKFNVWYVVRLSSGQARQLAKMKRSSMEVNFDGRDYERTVETNQAA